MPLVVRCTLSVARCAVPVVCYLWLDEHCSLFDGCRLLFVACCVLCGVCCLSVVAPCVRCSLCLVRLLVSFSSFLVAC